ncbi:MAG: hypothetical protein F6J93_14015 [Oscillatoria sp. SIO1A7]|nr:hypothetical protein [Oscillatoria sp. SIO1A7]
MPAQTNQGGRGAAGAILALGDAMRSLLGLPLQYLSVIKRIRSKNSKLSS